MTKTEALLGKVFLRTILLLLFPYSSFRFTFFVEKISLSVLILAFSQARTRLQLTRTKPIYHGSNRRRTFTP